MIFYLFFVIILLLISYPNQYGINNNIRLYISFIVLIFISIFRFDVGYDYSAYYSYLWPVYQYKLVEKLEPLSCFMFKISYILDTPSVVFVLFGLITYFFIFKAIIDISSDCFVSFFVYIFLFWLFSLGEIRQAAALSITFWGFRYVIDKKIIKYIFVCLFAMLFHASAAIALLIYFIYNYAKWYSISIAVIVLCFVLNAILKIFAENQLYTTYVLAMMNFSGGSMIRLFYLALYVFVFVVYICNKRNELKQFLILLLPSVVLPFIFFPVIALRVSIYFNVFYMLIIPLIFKKKEFVYKFLVMFVFFLFFIVNIYIGSLNSKSTFTPYKTIFFIDHPSFK